MALTTIKTGALADDAVTEDKIANAINTARAANTAKDLTALSASNLTSGTVPDARFPATLPAASAANLTAVPAANITGTLPAISATNLTNVPAANITGTLPAISGANLTNLPASGRAHNLVINGAMRVAQRSQSSTTSGYGDLDRWKHEYSNIDENLTFAQSDVVSSDSGDNPFAKGLTKCIKITNGNQTSGLTVSTQVNLNQQIEAQDLRNSGWNYNSSSSYITLSYYIKSSVSQNFSGFIKTADGTNYIYPYETGTLTANTWTKVTKTIPGASNLQIDNDTGIGLQVFAVAIYGTNFTDNATNYNQWSTWNSSMRSQDQATSWFTTNDATLEITGVQLEVGESASDFAHESYQDTLLKCARYFYSATRLPAMSNYASGYVSCCSRPNPVPMRAAPSLTNSGGLTFNAFFVNVTPPTTNSAPGLQSAVNDNFVINFGGWGSTQTNAFGDVYNATISMSAEL